LTTQLTKMQTLLTTNTRRNLVNDFDG